MLIVWNDSYSVEVPEIDAQHKRLVDMTNELNDALVKGQGKEATEKILNGLVDYTVSHFNSEENLLEKYGYPETFGHKKAHKEFIAKVSKFKEDFDNGEAMLSTEVVNFLCDWLVDHIKGEDQKYSEFLSKKINS
jgi:hemerythrin-like metal-binding protein